MQDACQAHEDDFYELQANIASSSSSSPSKSNSINRKRNIYKSHNYPSASASRLSLSRSLPNLEHDDSLCLPLPITLPKALQCNQTQTQIEKTDTHTSSIINIVQTQLTSHSTAKQDRDEDNSTLICEKDVHDGNDDQSKEVEAEIFSDCVQLDSVSGLMTFVDPDPRLLYLKEFNNSHAHSQHRSGNSNSSTGSDSGLLSEEVSCTAKDTDVHSIAWWGFKPTCRLKVSACRVVMVVAVMP